MYDVHKIKSRRRSNPAWPPCTIIVGRIFSSDPESEDWRRRWWSESGERERERGRKWMERGDATQWRQISLPPSLRRRRERRSGARHDTDDSKKDIYDVVSRYSLYQLLQALCLALPGKFAHVLCRLISELDVCQINFNTERERWRGRGNWEHEHWLYSSTATVGSACLTHE